MSDKADTIVGRGGRQFLVTWRPRTHKVRSGWIVEEWNAEGGYWDFLSGVWQTKTEAIKDCHRLSEVSR